MELLALDFLAVLLTIRTHDRINFDVMNSDSMNDALPKLLKSAAAKWASKRLLSFVSVLVFGELFGCLENLAAEDALEVVHWNHFLRIDFFHLLSGAHQGRDVLNKKCSRIGEQNLLHFAISSGKGYKKIGSTTSTHEFPDVRQNITVTDREK